PTASARRSGSVAPKGRRRPRTPRVPRGTTSSAGPRPRSAPPRSPPGTPATTRPRRCSFTSREGLASPDWSACARFGMASRGRALALAWRDATGRVLGARHREALEHLTATQEGSRSLDLPAGRAIREYGLLRIVGDRPADKSDSATLIEFGREIIWNDWRIVLGGSARTNGAQE